MTLCRTHFFKRIFVHHYPLRLTCDGADIGMRTGQRWLAEHRLTGKVAASRIRRFIPGVMLQRDQDILFIMWHNDEYSARVYEETGHAYRPLQIRQTMSRKGFVYKLANREGS